MEKYAQPLKKSTKVMILSKPIPNIKFSKMEWNGLTRDHLVFSEKSTEQSKIK